MALAEYPANDADADSLIDAGEDEGRVDELRSRVKGQSEDIIGESTDQTKSPYAEGEDPR